MEIEEFLKEKFLSANSIVLFGSYVRGERFNDIGVLVIGNFPKEYSAKSLGNSSSSSGEYSTL